MTDEDSLAYELKIASLNSQLNNARTTVSRAINILEQVKIAIEEDDLEEALELIEGALGNEQT